ncbi:MAG: hypothetical protein GY833_16445 [Aestuariibacter sp.]|nr:hypothetical protein [Aestuariibacter sp.]
MATRTIKFTVKAVKWFDRLNGNTYHSCRITRTRDGAILTCPFQYGYGDQYMYTALEKMAQEKWLPAKYRKAAQHGGIACGAYERENNYPIDWYETKGLKRECVANGVGDNQ